MSPLTNPVRFSQWHTSPLLNVRLARLHLVQGMGEAAHRISRGCHCYKGWN